MIFSNRRRGSYIGSDIIGSGIYTGISCDYSLYSNGIGLPLKIPFVEEGQRPEDEYFSLGDNEGILVQAGGNGFDTLGFDGVLLLVGELV